MKNWILITLASLIVLTTLFFTVISPGITARVVDTVENFTQKPAQEYNLDLIKKIERKENKTINQNYTKIIVYEDKEKFERAALVYNETLDSQTLENESPIIIIKTLDDETLFELKDLFEKRETKTLLILEGDRETGLQIREIMEMDFIVRKIHKI